MAENTNREEVIRVAGIYNNRINQVVEMINHISQYDKHLKTDTEGDIISMLDIHLHLSQSVLDIIIGLKHLDLCNAQEHYVEALYFAKIVALNCRELMNDFNKLTHPIIPKYKNDERYSKMVSEVGRVISEFNMLKSKVWDTVDGIRNKLIAHKDGSGLAQYLKLQEINLMDIHLIGNNISCMALEMCCVIFDICEYPYPFEV